MIWNVGVFSIQKASVLASLLLSFAVLTACTFSQAEQGGDASTTGQTHTVEIREDGGDMWFAPANIDVQRGDVIRFVQKGAMAHNVEFVSDAIPSGVDLGDIRTGPYLSQIDEVYELAIDGRFEDGEYKYVCTPHAMMGMDGMINVDGGNAPAPDVAAKRESLPEITGQHGLQELEYQMDGETKVFRLKAEKIRWETTEGKLIDAMAYNQQIPGPVIRATEGDRVRIVVENGMDEPHTTHWHGLWVPNNMDGVAGISQEPIMPGETFTYEFDAKPAGTRLYHSHFNAMSQEGAGLYGMFVIEEQDTPAELQADHEDLMLLGDGPLGYVINGKEFPRTEPLNMNMGERMRIRMANLGSMAHPMHMHGGFFTIVAKDGFPLKNPQDANTINVAPGETYDVIVHPQFGGSWIWHCHILSHATGPKDEDGNETAAGMISVIQVHDGETDLADLTNHTNH